MAAAEPGCAHFLGRTPSSGRGPLHAVGRDRNAMCPQGMPAPAVAERAGNGAWRTSVSDGGTKFGSSPRLVLGQAHSQRTPIADISILSSRDNLCILFPFDDMCALSPFDDMYALSLFDDIGAIMQIRTPLDLGLTIRDKRRKLKLSQNELARKAGVGRQWVVAIERGKSRAELGLVLRTLAALDLPLTINPGPRRFPLSNDTGAADIDAIVDAAKQDRT